MNTKKIVTISTLALIIALGMITTASAYQGDVNTKGPNYSPERHEAMMRAFKNNDFDSWKLLMNKNARKGKVIDVVNKDNFNEFVEMHELMEDGNFEEADKIRKKLGLGVRDGFGQGRGKKRGFGQGQRGREYRNENN